MDIISQLQEQANTIASVAFNTIGTLQRDAPPVRLSPNYPEPPADGASTAEDAASVAEQPKLMSAALVKAAKQAENDAIGQELQKQLDAAEMELKQVQELFGQATDNCLNLKKPD